MKLKLQFLKVDGSYDAIYKKYGVENLVDNSAEDYEIAIREDEVYYSISGKWVKLLTILPDSSRKFRIEKPTTFYADFVNIKAKYLKTTLTRPTEPDEIANLEGTIAFFGDTELYVFINGKWELICRYEISEGSDLPEPPEPENPEVDGYVTREQVINLIEELLDEKNVCTMEPITLADLNARVSITIQKLKEM